MPAIAINPLNSRAVVLHSALSAGGATATAQVEPSTATLAMPTGQAGEIQSSANPVIFLTLENEADPALDPLRVLAQAPAPGATIEVTVTVRNVGRRETGAITVSLYRGTSAAGELVDAQAVPEVLGFNDTATVVFAVPVPATLDAGGRTPFFVRLLTNGENTTATNDAATIVLGNLSAPSRVELAGENPEFEGALDLAWSGNAGEYVTGYRILRAAAPTGLWALAGESAVPSFTDTGVTRGQSYCYAVQSYNAAGALSPRGPATCAPFSDPAGSHNLYLPVVSQR
jgi:hypothetical protein